MPTYDYRCEACGHEFEEFQNFSAGTLRKCPECKKLKLKRLIGSGAGILFKGSGFYETDYRSESYKKAAAGDQSKSEASPADSTPDEGAPNVGDKKAPAPKPGKASTDQKPTPKGPKANES